MATGRIAYNASGAPLAVDVLYLTFGVLVSSIVNAPAMPLSSGSVIANARRLRTLKLRSTPRLAR